jgi:hypothetical protein
MRLAVGSQEQRQLRHAICSTRDQSFASCQDPKVFNLGSQLTGIEGEPQGAEPSIKISNSCSSQARATLSVSSSTSLTLCLSSYQTLVHLLVLASCPPLTATLPSSFSFFLRRKAPLTTPTTGSSIYSSSSNKSSLTLAKSARSTGLN